MYLLYPRVCPCACLLASAGGCSCVSDYVTRYVFRGACECVRECECMCLCGASVLLCITMSLCKCGLSRASWTCPCGGGLAGELQSHFQVAAVLRLLCWARWLASRQNELAPHAGPPRGPVASPGTPGCSPSLCLHSPSQGNTVSCL